MLIKNIYKILGYNSQITAATSGSFEILVASSPQDIMPLGSIIIAPALTPHALSFSHYEITKYSGKSAFGLQNTIFLHIFDMNAN